MRGGSRRGRGSRWPASSSPRNGSRTVSGRGCRIPAGGSSVNAQRALVLTTLALALGGLVRSQEPPPAAVPAAPAAPAAPPAALQEAKDAFKKGACPEALDAALRVLQEQPTHLEGLYIAGACERQLNQL